MLLNLACNKIGPFLKSGTLRILQATDELGIPRRDDIHDPTIPPYACGLVDVTVDENGQRHSTFDAFLNPEIMASRVGNLFVCTDTVVSRLDIQPERGDLRVAGAYMRLGSEEGNDGAHEYRVSAKSEVIMCAGAIVTPQILMLRYYTCALALAH